MGHVLVVQPNSITAELTAGLLSRADGVHVVDTAITLDEVRETLTSTRVDLVMVRYSPELNRLHDFVRQEAPGTYVVVIDVPAGPLRHGPVPPEVDATVLETEAASDLLRTVEEVLAPH